MVVITTVKSVVKICYRYVYVVDSAIGCICGRHCYRCVYVVGIAIGVSMWWTLL